MRLHELKPNQKASRIRRGRGSGSGKGTFSGRGCKGQNSRSGGGVRIGFEGGQSGLLARIPKWRGFKNPNRIEAQTINLGDIEEHFKAGEKVTLASLAEKKLIHPKNTKVKILSNGELSKKVEITEEILISASAQKAVEKAGGKVSSQRKKEEVPSEEKSEKPTKETPA